SQTFTATVNVTNDRTNIATVTGTPSDEEGSPLPDVDGVTDSDEAVVDIVAPGVTIIKTAGTAPDGTVLVTQAGNVTYTYEVTNSGDIPLIDIEIVDDNGTPGNTNDDLPIGTIAGPLAPGASRTFTATINVTDDRTNIATVTGTPSDEEGSPLPGVNEVTDTDNAVVDIVAPGVTIIKTAGTAPDGTVLVTEAGDVLYTYEVTNTGDTPLIDLEIIDDNGTPAPGDDFVVGAIAGPLAPGASRTFTATINVTNDRTNIATVTGTPSDEEGNPLPGVDEVNDSDEAVVEIEGATNPEIAIEKRVLDSCQNPPQFTDNTLRFRLGADVTFGYFVTNPGTEPLANVRIIDDNATPNNPSDDLLFTINSPEFVGGDTNGDTLLDPGEIWRFEFTKTAEFINSNISNITTDSFTNDIANDRAESLRICDPALLARFYRFLSGIFGDQLQTDRQRQDNTARVAGLSVNGTTVRANDSASIVVSNTFVNSENPLIPTNDIAQQFPSCNCGLN
ncbi:hypothetical protein, partial [Gloeocapsa sp. PCC 73106]|uniref:DUF7507 domain-containing protein n=1 Tax=Gloeocapsa sp. PCC 73106 TaxID=102232 RepID=UPI0002ACD496